MKFGKWIIVAVLVAFAGVCAIFGEGKPQPQPQPPRPEWKPSFVEEPVPDGKAVVYFYTGGWAIPITTWIFTKEGPIAVVSQGYYWTYLTEPGSMVLWPVAVEGTAATFDAPSMTPLTLSIQVGQSYFIKADGKPKWLREVAAETAKTKSEILNTKKANLSP